MAFHGALQVMVLRAPALKGYVAIPDPPLSGVLAHILRRSEGRVEVPDSSRGEVWAPGC